MALFTAIIGALCIGLGAYMAITRNQIAERSRKHRTIGASGWRLLGWMLVLSGIFQLGGALL